MLKMYHVTRVPNTLDTRLWVVAQRPWMSHPRHKCPHLFCSLGTIVPNKFRSVLNTAILVQIVKVLSGQGLIFIQPSTPWWCCTVSLLGRKPQRCYNSNMLWRWKGYEMCVVSHCVWSLLQDTIHSLSYLSPEYLSSCHLWFHKLYPPPDYLPSCHILH